MSVSEEKIPVVVFDLGGTEATCVACGEVIDRDEERYVFAHGGVSMAAHLVRIGDDDEEVDDRCLQTLRSIWEAALAEAEAVVLKLGHDAGGTRFFAGVVPLHAGTPLDVLGADGHWLIGRFEYTTGRRPRALLYVGLGGFDTRPAALELSVDTVVRVPRT